MRNAPTYCVFAFLAILTTLCQSCIGDDLSDCGYDIPLDTRNVHLAFKYKPAIEGEDGPTADMVNQYSLMVYDSTETLKDKIINMPYEVTNDSIDLRMELEPGLYYFVFLADNTRRELEVNTPSDLEDIDLSVDTTTLSKPFALYYAFVDSLRVPETGIAERKTMMEKLSNKIRVNATGVDDKKYVPQEIMINMLIANSSYNWAGEIADTNTLVRYLPEYSPLPTGRSGLFSTLSLAQDTRSYFDICAKNQTSGQTDVLFKKDLIELLNDYLQLYGKVKELKDIHEFKIDIDFKSTKFDLYVNDWLLIKSDQEIN